MVDRADTDTLRALVAPPHRLTAVKVRYPIELGDVVVEYHSLLEHPVPVSGNVDTLKLVGLVLADARRVNLRTDLSTHYATSAIRGNLLTPCRRRTRSPSSGTILLNSWVIRIRRVVYMYTEYTEARKTSVPNTP
ncbi:hypothetical protein BMS3Bbin02_01666 [bacterium BMS3Bbin02]|nr:hypothetical protein BMS3Bbin02_01666 [bacterium BMS3Bbin02]